MDKIGTGLLTCQKEVEITFLVLNYDENKSWNIAVAQLLKLLPIANWGKA